MEQQQHASTPSPRSVVATHEAAMDCANSPSVKTITVASNNQPQPLKLENTMKYEDKKRHSIKMANDQHGNNTETLPLNANGGVNFARRSRARCCHIPLVGVLGMQICVVFGAFIAVIVVLSMQQEREFKDALYKQISLQQKAAATDIIAPLKLREEKFDQLVRLYFRDNPDGGEGPGFPPYTLPNDNSTFVSMSHFVRIFQGMLKTDANSSIIAIANRTDRWSTTAPNANEYSLFALQSIMTTYIHNELAHVCAGAFPSIPSCLANPMFPIKQSWDTGIFMGPTTGLTKYWTRPLAIYNPVAKRIDRSVAYRQRVNPANDDALAIVTVRTDHIRPIMIEASPTEGSRSGLFVIDVRVFADHGVMHLVTGKFDFNETIRPPPQSNAEAYTNTWAGGSTPDAVLNDAFNDARRYCYFKDGPLPAPAARVAAADHPCVAPHVYEIESGGSRFTCTTLRITDTLTTLDWLLVQYTPREEFFGPSDEARMIGIIIGVIGACVVFATCIAIWLSIFFPLRLLRSNMGLAADMQNDAVVPHDPLLGEMSDLVDAFTRMNTKLLKARPFLPQSLLLNSYDDDDGNVDDEDDEEEEGEVEDDDEGGAFGKSGGNKKPHRHQMVESGDDSVTDKSATVSHCTNITNNIATRVSSQRQGAAATAGGRKAGINRGRRGKGGEQESHIESASQMTVKSSSSHGGGARAPMTLVRSAAFDTTRRVGILSINVCGFQSAFTQMAGGAAVMAALHKELTRVIEASVGEERGIVDYFHGDRFVCGFNTVRACGNVAASAGHASVKIWERFCASHRLSEAFPHGLAMGLGCGRAVVGNHGSDTMQRLATLGYVFTEAMRLQEVMSRQIILAAASTTTTPVATLSPLDVSPCSAFSCPYSSGVDDGAADGRVSRSVSAAALPSSPPPPLVSPLLGGRCLVMGRALQDIETMLAFQVVGAVHAKHLMPSADGRIATRVQRFAKAKNLQAVKVCSYMADAFNQQQRHTTAVVTARLTENEQSNHTVADGGDPLALPQTNMANIVLKNALPASSVSRADLLLVACITGTLAGGGGGGRNNKGAQADDEWLYAIEALQNGGEGGDSGNPYLVANAAICNLIVSGEASMPVATASAVNNMQSFETISAPQRWRAAVGGIMAKSAEIAITELTYV